MGTERNNFLSTDYADCPDYFLQDIILATEVTESTEVFYFATNCTNFKKGQRYRGAKAQSFWEPRIRHGGYSVPLIIN